jgi:hypothetical protein
VLLFGYHLSSFVSILWLSSFVSSSSIIAIGLVAESDLSSDMMTIKDSTRSTTSLLSKKSMPVRPFQLVVTTAILYPTSFSLQTCLQSFFQGQFEIVVAVCILLLPVEQGIVKIPISHVVGESRQHCPLLLLSAFLVRIRSVSVSCIQTPVESCGLVFAAASWYESETWDMSGICFTNPVNLTRFLT